MKTEAKTRLGADVEEEGFVRLFEDECCSQACEVMREEEEIGVSGGGGSREIVYRLQDRDGLALRRC